MFNTKYNWTAHATADSSTSTPFGFYGELKITKVDRGVYVLTYHSDGVQDIVDVLDTGTDDWKAVEAVANVACAAYEARTWATARGQTVKFYEELGTKF